MLWETEDLKDGTGHRRRICQPQSDPEYAEMCRTFPDPQAPSTHEVVYHWENGPSRNHSRRIVFEPVVTARTATAADVVAASKAKEPAPKSKFQQRTESASQRSSRFTPEHLDVRRKSLTAMSEGDFAVQYAQAGLGSPDKGMSRAQLVAHLLEKEEAVPA